jgi:VanZ family protein
LWWGIAVVITYGSVYPFDFQAQQLDAQTLQVFLDSCCNRPGRGDVLGNIVLFVPFGFLGVVAAGERSSLSRRVWSTSIVGVAFAFALQVAQIYLPSRDENLQDVFWNLLGLLAGAQTGIFAHKHFLRSTGFARELKLIPSLLIGSWLIYRLIPFVPSIDLQMIKDSLKPLLLYPEFDALAIAANTAGWLVIGSFLQSVRRDAGLDRYLPAIIAVVFGLEVLIVHNEVNASNVAGAVLAVGFWWSLLRNVRGRTGLLFVLLCAVVIADGLAPFTLRAYPASFAWLPFRGLLGGSMYLNVQAICYKVFVYGSLVYLLWETRIGRWAGVVIATAVVAFVEFEQIYVVDHTPEITDPLLVVLAAMTMLSLSSYDRRPRRGKRSSGHETDSELVSQSVNLRRYQTDFLANQAECRRVNVSEVCRGIIDEFINEQSASEAMVVLDSGHVETALTAAPRNVALAQSWVKEPVLLRRDQIHYIEDLSRERDVSVSRATRRIIARFIREGRAHPELAG